MSRMKRLKKEKIKATMSGLALMIAIGVAGGVGSYAYFTDQAEAKNDLVVTMGNLDVNFKDKSNDVSINKENYVSNNFTQTFKIHNNGSLKQNVKFGFENVKVENESNTSKVLNNINYTLTMKHGGKDVVLRNIRMSGSLSELKVISSPNQIYDLIYSDGSMVELGKDESIACTLIFNLASTSNDILTTLQNNNIIFNTKVESIQVGGAK